jgi:hypothetical protein
MISEVMKICSSSLIIGGIGNVTFEWHYGKIDVLQLLPFSSSFASSGLKEETLHQ